MCETNLDERVELVLMRRRSMQVCYRRTLHDASAKSWAGSASKLRRWRRMKLAAAAT